MRETSIWVRSCSMEKLATARRHASTARTPPEKPGSGMGMHVDDFEESLAPVISLSIGDEALFRMGNTENRNKPWDDRCKGLLKVIDMHAHP